MTQPRDNNMITAEQFADLRAHRDIVVDQLRAAVNAAQVHTTVHDLLASHADLVSSFVGAARYVVSLYDALLASRDAAMRGTANMPPDRLQARLAVMKVQESIIEARLVEEIEHILRFAHEYFTLREQ